MDNQKSLLSGLDVPSGKPVKSKEMHARADLLDMGGGGKTASTSAKQRTAPAAGHDTEGDDSSSKRNNRLKLGIVTLCLAVAGVLVAQYAGLIELWGSVPPPPPPTPEEVEHVQQGVKQIQQEQQRIEALPPEKRPIQAGS